MARKPKRSKPVRTQPDDLSALARPQRLEQQRATRANNKLAQGPSRWQRAVRYVWDKKRG